MMMTYIMAVLIGIVAGMRTMTAPAAIAWAAWLGWIDLSGGTLAVMGYSWTPWIFTALALAELVVDQLPSTPSRLVRMQLFARLLSGAVCGGAIGAIAGLTTQGIGAGVAGAAIGAVCGAGFRAKLTATFGWDRPGALIEDALAIGGAAVVAVAFA